MGAPGEGFWGREGTLALDLRLEPNPRPLNREFIELIRSIRAQSMRGGKGGKRKIAVRCPVAAVSQRQTDGAKSRRG